MDFKRLPFANLRHNLGRTVGLVILVALLAFVAYGGLLVTSSLRNGLGSLEDRLGADIIVAPKEAKSKHNLEAILLDGTPGQFYMDRSFIDKVAAIEGVEAVSPQYYLATAKAGCCTMPVQVIGFDPTTDFTIQPWIARSVQASLGREDVVTGSNISGAAGSKIKFYGVECNIVGRLGETGTALDNAVFATNETLQDLILGSQQQGIAVLAEHDPTQVVSTIQVKVVDGANVGLVADTINLKVRGVAAVQTRAMVSGVADSMGSVARIVRILMLLLCAVALVLLVVAFTVVGRGRAREFAVLRMVGASRSMLTRTAIVEAVAESALGALVGIVLAAGAVVATSGLLEQSLGLPFLLPQASSFAVWAVVIFVLVVLAGSLASAVSAVRLGKVDAGQVLRQE